MAVVILLSITKNNKVTTDTIYGAICVYLLIGIIWLELFSIVEMIEPGSFLSGGENVVKLTGEFHSRPGFNNLLYFSFVTLTTLGYGDIAPATPLAKALSSLEAVVGQLFIAVLIARLVGMHIVHSSEKE
jgi:voltage-gated potassium channel Kch